LAACLAASAQSLLDRLANGIPDAIAAEPKLGKMRQATNQIPRCLGADVVGKDMQGREIFKIGRSGQRLRAVVTDVVVAEV
jgi:hypothetical protein